MVLHNLVGALSTHIHIEPNYFLVISSQHKVVTFGVDGDRRYPLGARFILVDDRLFLQIVLEDSHVSCREEVGLGRVERKCLDDALRSAEWFLGGGF